jgi:hypothetical protein
MSDCVFVIRGAAEEWVLEDRRDFPTIRARTLATRSGLPTLIVPEEILPKDCRCALIASDAATHIKCENIRINFNRSTGAQEAYGTTSASG